MRCHKVTAQVPGDRAAGLPATTEVRFAATTAAAKSQRDLLLAKHGIKKKDIEVEQIDVPLAKDDLLEFLNTLVIEAKKGATA